MIAFREILTIITLCIIFSLVIVPNHATLPEDADGDYANLRSHRDYHRTFWIDNITNHLLKTVKHIINREFTTKSDNTSLQLCYQHFLELIKETRIGSQWALRMVDSMGKPSSGIMDASLSFLGSYSECVDTFSPNFDGQYCLATVKFPSTALASFQKMSGLSPHILTNTYTRIGTCIPSSCTLTDITHIANKVAAHIVPNSSVSFSSCYKKDKTSILDDTASITVLAIFGVIVMLVMTGTLCDHIQEQSNSQTELMLWQENDGSKAKISKYHKPLYVQMLLAFSLKSNGNKILDTKTNENSINIFHGIRFLSMLWIIVGHSYSFAFQWMHFGNPRIIKDMPQNVLSQILANGTFSVDCFFYISGFLVSYLALKDLKRERGKFNWYGFYIHRYLRMTPSMMAVIAFSATILKYLGEGPSWTESITMFNGWCQKNWWINSLYLHNFINRSTMCLSHSWYSAVDMQFYMISPLILIPLYKRPNVGIGILLSLLTSSMVITGYLTASRHYPAVPYINDIVPQEVVDEYYGEVYIKPYCRIGPYLVGMALAYLIYSSHGDIKMKKIYSIIGWITALLVSVGVIFAMMPANNGNIPGDFIAALYSATSRTIWALSLSWVTFACITGYGWIFNWFLSLKLWVPLSRLTYCAYLIHPIVMASFYGSRTTTFHFSNYLMIYFIIGNLFITYTLSFILSLLFESPFLALEKLLTKRLTMR